VRPEFLRELEAISELVSVPSCSESSAVINADPAKPPILKIAWNPDISGRPAARSTSTAWMTGVDQIIHGGDIGHSDIIGALRKIAPVAAIGGNVDSGDWAGEYADTKLVRLAGRAIFVLHDLKTLQIDPVALGIDVVVSGHSHVPKIDTVGGVLYLNPGSAGRRRFKLPITLATLEITPDALRPVIHDLERD
jgi:putative phosphoesterase